MSGRRRESSVSRLHPWRPLFDPLPLQEKAWSKDQGCRSAGALARSSPLPEGEWSEWWTSFTDRRRALHRRNYTTHPTLRQRQTHPCDQENARQDDEQRDQRARCHRLVQEESAPQQAKHWHEQRHAGCGGWPDMRNQIKIEEIRH